MNVVPRMAIVALVSLAGLTPSAFAGGLTPGNGGSIILPTVVPPSVRDSLSLADNTLSVDGLGQKFGVQDGRLDFFSLRPADSGEFKPLLRGGFGDKGLQLQLKW